ncbi:MAG: tRNA lysidine(34) synthetase TilS [Wenzhouxiangellaceae bacterium]
MAELNDQVITRTGTNLVAFSGGPDSACLLHLLLSAGHRERIRAVHVDHGLDVASADRARQAAALASRMGIDCRIERVQAGHQPGAGGPEAAARHARYACLRALLGGEDHVLTAHHADDQIETVMLRLLRGAGPLGLAGMQPLRRLDPGWLGRPLLAWTRAQILEYLHRHRIEYLHDPTNRDLSLDRNYLRHRVLPAIEERWPGYRASVLHSARWQRAAADAVHADAQKTFKSLARSRDHSGETLIDLEAWLALEPSAAFGTVRAWCEHERLAAPPIRPLEEFRTQCLEAAGDRQPALDWSEACVHAYRNCLWLDRQPLSPVDWKREWPAEDRCPVPAGGELHWAGGETRSAIGKRWEIGAPEPGAQLRLHPERPQQQVRELMREAGIPPWRRHAYPALSIDGRLCAVGLEWLDWRFAERMEQHDSRLEWHQRPAALLP